MMGLGYLGSSSSSNLSPLAPPFTVDRSNHNKPTFNSHLNDPSYAPPFTSSWSYPPATQDSHTVSSNDSAYINPHNWTSHWSSVNPSPKPVTDSFSYNLTEAKPFYPPYASSVNNDDVPLVTLSKPGYDLLSTSGLVLGDESSQVDYTGSLSGLEYKPQREGLWTEGKHGKRMQSDDSFFSDDANIAASLAYNGYLNQGAYGADTLGKGKEDSSMFYHADMLRKENNIGPSINGKSDGASFSVNNHRLNLNEFSKGGPTFRAFPMFSESHPLVPAPEPPEEPWNTQQSYTLYEKKKFNIFDCSDDHLSPPITKSSSLVIKPPAAFSTFSAQGTTSRNLEFGNVAASTANDHKPSKEKELHLTQGLESKGSFLAPNQLSFQIGRTDEHMLVAPPSIKDVSTKLSANDRLNFEFKARSSFQVSDINIPNVNTAENMKSTANSFEHFDHHNPAEDSPCWKGAPTSHFLPFGSPEAVSPQHPTKKLQTGNGVNQTDPSINHSSIGEYKEKTSGSIPVESEAVGAKVSSRGGTQTVHETIKTRKAHSDANSQTCQLKSPINEEDAMSPEMKTQLLSGDVEHSVHAVERILVPSMEAAASLATSKKVNASILVKTLHNLSDLLFLHCSDDEYALKEQDQEAIDHVIANLNACMSRKVQVPPTNKSIPPLQNSSNMSQESQVKSDITGKFHESEAGHDQKQNSDNVEDSASLRDEADDNMIQAIKKLLDENLECKEELPSKTLLYKNLWLEAEAELCSLNYRARFERMKGETSKPPVSDASEKGDGMKKISSSNGSDLKSPPKLIDKGDGSQNPSLSGVAEASVMARFNILKLRESVEASGKGSGSDICTDENVEPSVMSRLNILKRRGEANGEGSGKLQYEANKAEAVGNDSGWYSGSGSDWEHIFKDEFSWQSNGRLT